MRGEHRHRWRARISSYAICAVLGFGAAPQALACAFHGYTPNPTLVDLLLETEQVVFADLDPRNPDRFRAVSVLMGPPGIDIPLPVSTKTRLDLQQTPGARILLVRDGPYGAWMELALMDTRMEEVVRHVLQSRPRWQLGGDEARAKVFSGYVNAANPALRRLALQELDRAPYAILRAQRIPSVAGLKGDLQQRADPDLRPIQILLAGLSDDPDLIPVLQDGLEAALERETPYLGAYATALIELGGASEAERIMAQYLGSGRLSADQQEKLLQALAIQHKAAPAKTRRVIERGVAQLARKSPELREAAARQFGTRNHPTLNRANTDQGLEAER